MPTRPPEWGSRRSMGWGPSAGSTTRRTSTSRPSRSCRGRPCLRALCLRSDAIRSWPAGGVAEGRRRITSGGHLEVPYGYSRAVVVGNTCHVAGTTDPSHEHPGDAAGQARAALAIIDRALRDAGFQLADVVRTRMYVTRPEDADPVARVHGQVFADIRPASTLVVISALVEPQLLVEIEADAVREPT